MARNEESVFKAVKADKVRLTDDQKQLIVHISDMQREVYNWALRKRIDNYKLRKENAALPEDQRIQIDLINFKSQCKELTVARNREACNWNQVPVNTSRASLDKVQAAFKSFFELVKKNDFKARPPRFRGYEYFFRIAWWEVGFKLVNGFLKLTHSVPDFPELNIKLDEHTVQLLEEAQRKWVEYNNSQGVERKKIKQCIKLVEILRRPVKFDSRKKVTYSISFVYHVPPLSLPSEIKNVLALSVGTKEIGMVDIHGEAWHIPVWRPDKHHQVKIEELDKKRGQCQKGSRQYNKYMDARSRIFEKWSSQLKDWQRKTAASIVRRLKEKEVNCIVLTKEAIRLGIAKKEDMSSHHHRGVQNTGSMARLVQYIEQKAKEYGIHIIIVKGEAISKTCSKCGKIHKEVSVVNTHHDFSATLCCDCGLNIARKMNGALNIMKRGIKFLIDNEKIHGDVEEIMKKILAREKKSVRNPHKHLPHKIA